MTKWLKVTGVMKCFSPVIFAFSAVSWCVLTPNKSHSLLMEPVILVCCRDFCASKLLPNWLCHDTQHNDIQNNDTQPKGLIDTQHDWQSAKVTLSIQHSALMLILVFFICKSYCECQDVSFAWRSWRQKGPWRHQICLSSNQIHFWAKKSFFQSHLCSARGSSTVVEQFPHHPKV